MDINSTNLIIFDIDGTLLNSMRIDSKYYIQSITDEFGINNINEDWSIYNKITDSGLFEEIYINHFKKKPDDDDFKKHENKFYKILKSIFENQSDIISEIPGAHKIITKLRSLKNYFISIATGSYKKTALLKLNLFNISENDIPLSTANDDKSRENVVKICIDKSKYFYNINTFDKIISIGDGIWDLKTAKYLKLPFIGIGKNRFNKIANYISLNDFLNQDIFFNALKDSFIPILYDITPNIHN